MCFLLFQHFINIHTKQACISSMWTAIYGTWLLQRFAEYLLIFFKILTRIIRDHSASAPVSERMKVLAVASSNFSGTGVCNNSKTTPLLGACASTLLTSRNHPVLILFVCLCSNIHWFSITKASKIGVCVFSLHTKEPSLPYSISSNYAYQVIVKKINCEPQRLKVEKALLVGWRLEQGYIILERERIFITR